MRPPRRFEKRRRPVNWQDRTGERIGRLVVTGWAGYGRGTSHNYWEARCDCGGSTVSRLVGARSCGCLQEEARDRGRRSAGKKTTLALEKALGRPMTLARAARAFHVKQTTLRNRMWRHPDNPAKWKLTKRRPPRIKRRLPS